MGVERGPGMSILLLLAAGAISPGATLAETTPAAASGPINAPLSMVKVIVREVDENKLLALTRTRNVPVRVGMPAPPRSHYADRRSSEVKGVI